MDDATAERSVEGRPLEDAELVERAREGDLRAYEELVDRHREVAFRAAYLITRSAEDAEDAVQEGFVKAFRALDRFRAEAPFRPWILRIVVNEARNRSRSERRQAALTLRAAADRPPGEAADAGPSPEAAALAGEEREALGAALGRLPARDREVISLRYLLELSERETAAALGVRPGTVKSRLSRALARLREELPRATRGEDA